MGKRIYLDYASTTPLRPEVLEAMAPFWNLKFGNPASPCREGVEAWNAMTGARKTIAQVLHSRPDEIIFTGSGTESNNLAIFGAVAKMRQSGLDFSDIQVITSPLEHSSVLECLKALAGKGLVLTFLPVGKDGLINPRDLEQALTGKTALVSLMYANNEIGTVQPIKEVGRVIRKFKNRPVAGNRQLIFHVDASQAPLYLPLNLESLGADLLTLDGHKIYGPKGVGALFVSRDVEIMPIMKGGEQEKGLRAGTENVPFIVGLAKALELADLDREKESARLLKLRDYAIDKLLKLRPGILLNGSRTERLPNNINISLPGVDTEFLVIQLDERGIATSTKSACLSDEPASYVVKALDDDSDRAKSTLRITLGKDTKKSDIDFLLKCLKELLSNSKS